MNTKTHLFWAVLLLLGTSGCNNQGNEEMLPTQKSGMTIAEKYPNVIAFLDDSRGFWNQQQSGWNQNRFKKFVNSSGSTLEEALSSGGNLGDTDFGKAANLSGKCFQAVSNQIDLSDCDKAERLLLKYDYTGASAKLTQKERQYYSGGVSLAELKEPNAEQLKKLSFIKRLNCNPAPIYGDLQPASFARVDRAQWARLSCERKIAAIEQIGQYCGRLTYLNPDDNINAGLGAWDPEKGAMVLGVDNCGTI